MGNMGVATPAILFMLLMIVFLIEKLCRVRIPKKYSASEKQELLEQLAITLLIIRDGKVTSEEVLSNINKQLRSKLSPERVNDGRQKVESSNKMVSQDDAFAENMNETLQSSVLALAHELALFESLEYIETHQYDSLGGHDTVIKSSSKPPYFPSSGISKKVRVVAINEGASSEAEPQRTQTLPSEKDLNDVVVDGIELANFYVDKSRENIKTEATSLPSMYSLKQPRYIMRSENRSAITSTDTRQDKLEINEHEFCQDNRKNNPVRYLNAEANLNRRDEQQTVHSAILIPTSITGIRYNDNTVFVELATWCTSVDTHIKLLMGIYGQCPGIAWSTIATSQKYQKVYQSTKAQFEDKQFLKDLHTLRLFDKPSLEQFHALFVRMREQPEHYRTFQIQYFEDVRSELKKLLKKLMTLLMVHGSVVYGCDIGEVLSIHAQDIGYCIGTSQWELSELEYYVDMLM
jgi:hypothetical protein